MEYWCIFGGVHSLEACRSTIGKLSIGCVVSYTTILLYNIVELHVPLKIQITSTYLPNPDSGKQIRQNRVSSTSQPLLRPTFSQNRLNLQTRPTPAFSSHCLTPSLLSSTSPLHTLSTHLLSRSLTLSFSMARLLATNAGATGAMPLPPPGTHSGGSTHRCTRASGVGRDASLRERRMHTRERASRRDTTVVWVRKMERRISSASEGRDGECRSGLRDARVRRRRRECKTGATERRRR